MVCSMTVPNPRPLQVWLSDWEHRCCGQSRRVGQDVEIRANRFDGEVWEQRHPDRGGRGDVPTATIRGQILDIKWHRARTTSEGVLTTIIGYEPGIDITTTDDITEQGAVYGGNVDDVRAWSIEFTILLDDESVNTQIPDLRATAGSAPGYRQAEGVVGEDMPEFDDEHHARWRMEADSDGWKWWTPYWDQRVSTDSTLALAVEALRRGVDLRDACAEIESANREAGENKRLTLRTLHLIQVLNALLDRAVAERADALHLTVDRPHDPLSDMVRQLSEAGILTAEEYRPSD
jgi:hypothetical protein